MGGRNHCSHQHGVTLVEVLTVVVIVGVMAAIAVPSLRAIMPGYHLRAARRNIVSLMQHARIKAIATGHPCYLALDDPLDNTYTCYLDTDHDSVGELDNEDSDLPAASRREYRMSEALFDGIAPDKRPFIRLSGRTTFGSNATKGIPGAAELPADGIAFNGTPQRAAFYPSGRGKPGTIYLQDARSKQSYAISVSIVGRIFVRTWNAETEEWVES